MSILMISNIFPSMYIKLLGTDPLLSIINVRLLSLMNEYPVK